MSIRIAFRSGVVACLTLAGACAVPRDPNVTALAESIVQDTLTAGGVVRTFAVYGGTGSTDPRPIVLVLHGGSGGSGARIRSLIGRELEALADHGGFLLAYPDGVEGSWNDCREGASYPAKVAGIDDVGFLRELISRVGRRHGGDTARVAVVGYSNGAHLAYRIALEAPTSVIGVAAFAANLPHPDAMDCRIDPNPVPVLMINGTADPINPYRGGEVTLPDGTSLGRVRSALESLDFFGRLAGHDGAPGIEPLRLSSGAVLPQVKVTGWDEGTPVVLYTVEGGGHTIPTTAAVFPDYLGATEHGFSGAEAAIRFFGLAAAR